MSACDWVCLCMRLQVCVRARVVGVHAGARPCVRARNRSVRVCMSLRGWALVYLFFSVGVTVSQYLVVDV